MKRTKQLIDFNWKMEVALTQPYSDLLGGDLRSGGRDPLFIGFLNYPSTAETMPMICLKHMPMREVVSQFDRRKVDPLTESRLAPMATYPEGEPKQSRVANLLRLIAFDLARHDGRLEEAHHATGTKDNLAPDTVIVSREEVLSVIVDLQSKLASIIVDEKMNRAMVGQDDQDWEALYDQNDKIMGDYLSALEVRISTRPVQMTVNHIVPTAIPFLSWALFLQHHSDKDVGTCKREECKAWYIPWHGKRLYCSKECHDLHWQKMRKETHYYRQEAEAPHPPKSANGDKPPPTRRSGRRPRDY